MNIIIIGAGDIGTTLAEILASSDHNLTVIEKDPHACERLLSEIDTTVIKGDATDPEILEDAKIEKCDVFVAVSGRDEINFITSVYAKNKGVKKVIAKVGQKEYERIMHKLGIETIMPEMSTAREIDLRIIKPTTAKLVLHGMGNIEILEFEITDKSPFLERNISEIPSKLCEPIVIHRDNEFILNPGSYTLKKGDIVVVLCRPQAVKDVIKLFKASKHSLRIFK